MCAVVCSYCMSHQHLDAKIVNISHRDVWVVSHRNLWVGTYFRIAWLTHTKADMLGWHSIEIEEWLLLSSMCAVVCSYCMSHQHLNAKIVKNFP